MAATLITNGTIALGTAITYPATAAVASDGTNNVAVITPTKTSGLIFIRLTNNDQAATEVATILGGGLDFLNPHSDIATTMTAATTYDFVVSIADYIQQSGTYKGKIVVKGASTDTKVAASELPYHA